MEESRTKIDFTHFLHWRRLINTAQYACSYHYNPISAPFPPFTATDRRYALLKAGSFSSKIRNYCTSSISPNASNGLVIRSVLQKNSPVAKKLQWLYVFPLGVLGLAYHLYSLGVDKQVVIDRRNKNIGLPPAPLPYNPTKEQLDELDHRQVYVSGEFLHERELRVYPRYLDSELGMHVITPIRRPDNSIVLINRGWVPAALKDPESRMEAQITDKVTILGHLIPGEDPFPFKFLSDKPLFSVANSPEKNLWPRVDLEEMGEWVNSSPILIAALADPPNPGGIPYGGQADLRLKNDLLSLSYQYAGLAAFMVAAIIGGRYVHRAGIRLPWAKKPPTPFTD